MADPKVVRDTSMLRAFETSKLFEETKNESDRKSLYSAGNLFITIRRIIKISAFRFNPELVTKGGG